MQPSLPLARDLVLVGGGHTHALVLRRWGMAPLPGVRVTLISPEPTAPYTGMLPAHVGGHYDRDALDIDLVRLARHAGARLILGRVGGIDRAAKTLDVPGRPPVGYDVASFDIGIEGDLPAIKGWAAHGLPAKPLGPFATHWAAYLEALRRGDTEARIVLIGGGVAGVELALAMAYRLDAEGHRDRRVHLVEAGAQMPTGVGAAARRRLLKALQAAGVTLHPAHRVTEVTASAAILSDGTRLPASLTIATAGARPQAWLEATDLPRAEGGITVGPTLNAVDDPDLFAVGDCAHLSHAPRPKAGVFAVREAPVLYRNLVGRLSGRPLRRYDPQRSYLKLITLGDRKALADKAGLCVSGPLLWQWKDRIDRTFMDRFQALPEMTPPQLPRRVSEGVQDLLGDGQMPCGGCGAKVGPLALRHALGTRLQTDGPAGGTGPGDDAAIRPLGDGRVQVLTTDHLRAFTEDAFRLAQIAAIHALGDIWAMGAQPDTALATLILPRQSDALLSRQLEEILAGLELALDAAGTALAGGHTSVGAELTVGLTVTGICERAPVMQSAARAGDALILTKPIGTGVLLAAEMAKRARGWDVAAAFDSMARPMSGDAACLAPVAHAMTDVTGFGLAGHLLQIARASGVSARLNRTSLPLLDGAETLAAAGVRSTLWADNAAQAPEIASDPDPRAQLLFDPQTAGGLLASVPADAAGRVLEALRQVGAPAAHIGSLEPGPPWLSLD